MNRFVVAVLLCSLALAVRAELWLPSVFGNGMVLQADRPVPVWGEADAGAEVTVEFAGQKKTAVADSSKQWKVVLDPLSVSSEPRKLKVSSQVSSFEFQVSIGEVWVLAGQSNMGWPLANCDGGKEAAAAANYPWLRIFSQWPNQGACDEPARDVKGGQWNACTPEQAARLSGVGFFFARALHPHLDGVPIALINTQMGGTYAECWIDLPTLEKTPSALPYLEKAAKEIKPGEFDPKGYWGENNFRRPAALYNGKVAPLQPFAVRGVLWYQGEGNSQKWLAAGHAETLTALVESWRRGFDQPKLPFLIVQLPRHNAGAGNDWPAVRAAQAQVARDVPGVELAVTIDCGSNTQIHPPDKEPVGERLALLARAKVYGQDIACSGPVFQSLEKAGDALLVRFEYSNGLFFKGGAAQGVEVCGADRKFVPAQAEILPGGAVKVSSPEVGDPVAVRYGWFNWGEANLFNGAGLPAAPFSTEGVVRGI